jgi:hypothetical protein
MFVISIIFKLSLNTLKEPGRFVLKTIFIWTIFFSVSAFFTPMFASAQIQGLPYTTRTNPYSGWSGIVKGDNNTIGMAGATVALPNSIAAMEYNPAGYAMNLGGLTAQINSFTNKDPSLNRGSTNYEDYEWGLGTSIPPWGFGVSYYSPTTEHSDTAEVSVREVKINVARMIGKDLAIGLGVGFDKGIRKMAGEDLSGTHVSAQVGALYKLEDHWVLGASYSPGLTIGPTGNSVTQTVSSFNQDIDVPNVIALGLGWMPNRYFRAGFSILGITGTSDTALLYNPAVSDGNSFTVEPRLGASYILGEWHFLKVELAVGSYFEQSRVQGIPNRTHKTFGLDVNPWFINTGVGTDVAQGYVNWNVSVGIDLVRTFRFFQLIPADPVPFYEGMFPPIFKINPNGLADGFTKGEAKTISPPSAGDVTHIVEDLPEKLNQKFGGTLPDAPVVDTPKESAKKIKVRKKKRIRHPQKNISPKSGNNAQ